MVFIGTDNVLEEIPYDADMPAFSLTKIEGEFLPVADKFSKANIYYVATGRGCGCDFGIYKADPKQVKRHTREVKVANIVRKVFGQRPLQECSDDYAQDTLQLIDCIDSNTLNGSTVELYCCWAGGYADPASDEMSIDISTNNLKDDFAIDEDMKITFYRT